MAHIEKRKIDGRIVSVCVLDSSAQEIDDAVDAIPGLREAIAAVIPSGLISMWSGAVANIPKGWLLCDGSNGTPDLRGRFIVGAGGDYAVGDTGGANTVALTTEEVPSHTHKFTGEAHSHDGTINMTGLNCSEAGAHTHSLSGTISGTMKSTEQNVGSGSGRYVSSGPITATAEMAGTHTHTITGEGSVDVGETAAGGTNANTGGGKAHENRPPYYALCYIMKQ